MFLQQLSWLSAYLSKMKITLLEKQNTSTPKKNDLITVMGAVVISYFHACQILWLKSK